MGVCCCFFCMLSNDYWWLPWAKYLFFWITSAQKNLRFAIAFHIQLKEHCHTTISPWRPAESSLRRTYFSQPQFLHLSARTAAVKCQCNGVTNNSPLRRTSFSQPQFLHLSARTAAVKCQCNGVTNNSPKFWNSVNNSNFNSELQKFVQIDFKIIFRNYIEINYDNCQ